MNILPSVCMDPLLPALGQRSKVILVASKKWVKIGRIHGYLATLSEYKDIY